MPFKLGHNGLRCCCKQALLHCLFTEAMILQKGELSCYPFHLLDLFNFLNIAVHIFLTITNLKFKK